LLLLLLLLVLVLVLVPVLVLLLLLLLLTSGSPSAATEPVGKTRRATRMDARRFSTRHGCLVEKSRRRSGPSPRSGLGA